MFTDEKALVTIHAPLDNTLSRATFRNQDLIPVFLEAIKETAEYAQIITTNNYELKVISDPCADDDDHRWISEDCNDLLMELFEVLDSYSPDGYYFGSHIGDGSDFGYWKETGEETNDEYFFN